MKPIESGRLRIAGLIEDAKWTLGTDRKNFKELLDIAHASLGEIKEDAPLNKNTLFLLFYDPNITIQILTALHKTRIDQANESIFTAFQTKKGLATSKTEKLPAAVELRNKEGIKTPEDMEETNQNQTVATIHTHPPHNQFNDFGLFQFANLTSLIPSVIDDLDKNIFGDLYAFSIIHQLRQEQIEQGEKPLFPPTILCLILQEDLINGITKMLIITERKMLQEKGYEEYKQMLYSHRDKIYSANSQSEVNLILKNLGYNVSYLEKPTRRFERYPILNPTEFTKIVSDLTK